MRGSQSSRYLTARATIFLSLQNLSNLGLYVPLKVFFNMRLYYAVYPLFVPQHNRDRVGGIKTGRFNKAMKIKNATPSRLEATIKATGKVMGLKDFKVSPATMRTGENRPEVVKAKVLKSGGMKPLQMGSLKAFVRPAWPSG